MDITLLVISAALSYAAGLFVGRHWDIFTQE